ncbi:uncharacterized protein LAESUDRAFT_815426 [Laetiporus sulphureus 93-53]|uniref:Metalloenzyme domain-containing protein n=1 Tax=Laetiporus sulphureus 93-53 TaxID=1314785 RepID=A0A165C519_9APHY|nr:uncharacterized protein LAESUDRAFT_815426 [Laetiporus sulphureus 93-53]KZT02217.1 hypothetical protein LAESUDRAFT_815426 [Laetiporus sulphureus 93-53]
MLGLPDKPVEVDVPKDLLSSISTPMPQCNAEFPLPVAFPPQSMTNILAGWLANQGIKQAHVAETQKNAPVTFFFNGGFEKQYYNEERHMISSPKVTTYDEDPKMSVQAVTNKVAEVIRKGDKEFVIPVEAISTTDKAVTMGPYKACEEAGYILLITAEDGNAEQMINPETGATHMACTTNLVSLIMTGGPKKFDFTVDKKDGEDEEGAVRCGADGA